MKYKKIYFLISGILLVPGIVSLFAFGLKPSIDFTGGALWEIKSSKNKLWDLILQILSCPMKQRI